MGGHNSGGLFPGTLGSRNRSRDRACLMPAESARRPIAEAQERDLKISPNKVAKSNMRFSDMPNYSAATTPLEKFTKYSLDPDNPNSRGKAEAYERSLGYTRANATELRNKIHQAISTGSCKPYEVTQSEYGTKYKYRIPVTGPNGNTKNVIAVYQIDKGSKNPRMITNYVEGK